MKVMQILLSPRIGGAETLVQGLASAWQNEGIHSQTVYLDTETTKDPSRTQRLQRVRNAYKSYQPDIVLAHSALPNMYARLACPKRAIVVPVIHSASDDFQDQQLRLVEGVLRRIRKDTVVAVSEASRDQYLHHFGEEASVSVIYNGVEDLGFLGKPEAPNPRFLTLARVTKDKNPWLWIQVVKHYSTAGLNYKFDWIGPSDGTPQMDELVDGCNVNNSAGSFLGPLNKAASRLRDYDIYLHTSDTEAHSISILEAVTAGVPVICSDRVATSVGHDLVAATFKVGNSESAIEAVDDVVNNFADQALLAKSRRLIALEKFGMSRTARKYADLFNKLV